jgi:DNA-binding response OmpR family regulator
MFLVMQGNPISGAAQPVGLPLLSERGLLPRILVVEDDPVLLELNTSVLLLSGYEVEAAADGAAAWRALSNDGYDLLLTDNDMPELSGVELLKKLRAARMALPVIMATGISPEEEFARQPWLRPAATLLKPFTSEQMLRTVEKVLRATDSACVQPEPLAAGRRQPSPELGSLS